MSRDNTPRIAKVNTLRIASLCIAAHMDSDGVKADRLRKAREKAGYPNAVAAARAFGWGEAGYRHHENGTRGFGADAARKYGRAFKVKPGWLMAMEGFDEAPPVEQSRPSDDLAVSGDVEAGVWREAAEWSDDRAFTILEQPSPVPNAKRFGLTVRGYSMDLFYSPGTVLDCLSIFTNGVPPESGDHVIVERTRPDGLREMTVKEYLTENGRYFLLPRSTRPEFSDRIEIGAPTEGHDGDDQVAVIAFVAADYPPRVLRLFERLGKIRR